MRILGCWLGVALLVLLGPAGAAAEAPRQIIVTGEGRVQTVPNMAIVQLGVTAQAASAQDAMDDVSEDVRAIFQTVVDLGVAPRDLQTTALRLDPVFEDRRGDAQGPPGIIGFIATNDVALQLRDMAQVGTILQAVLGEGANRFSSIRFTLSDPAPFEAEARRAAVADARARAALYAEAAGITLGPVLSIVETGSVPPEHFATARMAMDAAIPLAQGELDVTARVTITYGIGG